jgi:hypothetical protein
MASALFSKKNVHRPLSATSTISTLSSIATSVSSKYGNDSPFCLQDSDSNSVPLKSERQQKMALLKEVPDEKNHTHQFQTSDRSQDITNIKQLDLYLPASRNLAAGFEVMERSLRNLQSKLDNLAMREMENDGEDSSAPTIISKVFQIIPQSKQIKQAIVPTESSTKTLLSDVEKKNSVVSSAIEREGREVQTTPSIYKSNIKINGGKNKKKPFIAGSRIPQRPKSSNINLIPIFPLQKEIKHEASHSSTNTSNYHDGRLPIAEVFSQEFSSSNISTSFTSFIDNHVDEKETDAHEHSFTISSTNFEPTLHLPLDLPANIFHSDAERFDHSTLNIVRSEVCCDELDKVNLIKQQPNMVSDSLLVNTETLSISSSKKLRLHPQPHVSNTSSVDSFINSSSHRVNLPMSSIKALVSLQQSRRLVFEALGQLEEIKEYCSNESILADSPEIPSSNNSSTIMRIPMAEGFPASPLHFSPLHTILPSSSSSSESQYSLDLKRSIAASLSLLPSQDELLRVEGHLKPERFYGDLLDEIHKKDTLLATKQTGKERVESSIVETSCNYVDRANISHLYQETDLRVSESSNIIDNLPIHQSSLSTTAKSQRIIPSTPTHMKINNARNESLLSRSTTTIQHDFHQEIQSNSDNESILNTQRIKRELEKWLSRPPLWNQLKRNVNIN